MDEVNAFSSMCCQESDTMGKTDNIKLFGGDSAGGGKNTSVSSLGQGRN